MKKIKRLENKEDFNPPRASHGSQSKVTVLCDYLDSLT